MNLPVSSVAKKEQTEAETPAAVFVITSDDIRRSGALNLPDVLRMVPGIDVGQINSSTWAISARGLNSQTSNKLLVMVDGRTVYNALFAGVFWDAQNLPLESIERIEVIRGPGAAVWGANAVNGVINIITKSSADTQGVLISATTGGNAWSSQGPDHVRYGGKFGAAGTYRLSAEGFDYASNPSIAGGDGHDPWHLYEAEFRVDERPSTRDSLIVEGDVYGSVAGEIVYQPEWPKAVTTAVQGEDRSSGWSVMTRWAHDFSPASSTLLQVSFDRGNRLDASYGVALNNIDLDFQHHLRPSQTHDLVWGLGYRRSSDDSTPEHQISLEPLDLSTDLFSAFVQDEIALRPQRLALTLGARFEHNNFTGANLQPTVRLAWNVQPGSLLWAAVSAADRTPSHIDTSVRAEYGTTTTSDGIPVFLVVGGNPNEKNEHVTAFESGYRRNISDRISLDAAAFYNQYRDLRSDAPGPSFALPPYILTPLQFGNGIYGETHGIELSAQYKVNDRWTLMPGYAFFASHMHVFRGLADAGGMGEAAGSAPDHQAQLRSSLNLGRSVQWNTSAYFVDRIHDPSVPSYTRLDSGVFWQAGERLELSVVGQNLIKERHLEFMSSGPMLQSSLVRRGAYAKLTWSF